MSAEARLKELGIVLPKVEDASHVHFVHHLLNQLEDEHDIPGRRCIEVRIDPLLAEDHAVNLRVFTGIVQARFRTHL